MAGIYDEEILGAKQQAALAKKLRDSATMPEGQMVSGWYVPPSITQYLATALKQYGANKEYQTETDKAEELRKTKAERTAELLRSLSPKAPPATQSPVNISDEKIDLSNSPPATQANATYQNPSQEEQMRALMEGMSVNPEAFQPAAQMFQWKQGMADKKDAREEAMQARQEALQQAEALKREGWQHEDERAKQARLDREAMVRLTAGLRPAPAEKMIAVMGKDGMPVMLPQSQASGMTPYNAQTQKAQGQNEQRQQATISAQQVLDQAAQLFNHPGRLSGTGMSSFMSAVPGTDAKGFKANLDTFKAQTFLPMVQALKGMGALSDAEGKKIADSVGALDPSMKESEFADSLKRTTQFLYNKAKASGIDVQIPEFAIDRKTATGKIGGTNPPGGGAKFLGFE